MEKLNDSIKNFNPKNFNEALDDIKERMDLMAERAMRIGGAFAGMQLFKINPYLGIAATAAGAFSPELAKIAKQYLENEEKQKKKRNEAVENSREVQRKIGWLPKQSTSTYAPRMQMIEEAEMIKNKKWWDFLTQNRENENFQFSDRTNFLNYVPAFQAPELNFKKTEHLIKLEVDFKGTENLSKEEIKKIAQETIDKSFSTITDELAFS